MMNGNEFITDNGNFIVDCHFGEISNPESLHTQINRISGIVDNGLFVQMASSIVVGYEDGTVRIY
ncbi:Ribose-5-phosphate isomerase A [compost metagenome]